MSDTGDSTGESTGSLGESTGSLGESTGSLDWAIVDNLGDIPDDDSTSNASSVEVVDDDNEDDESLDCHGTPVAGSPNDNMPKFVLRLSTLNTQNVSDTDEEVSEVSNSVVNSETSIVSVPESIPSTSVSEQNIAGQIYRQTSTNTSRISSEEIADLCNKIDNLKKALETTNNIDSVTESTNSVDDVTLDDLFGDGVRQDRDEQTVNCPSSGIENIGPARCQDGYISMESSISSSYSFLSRDTATETLPEPVLTETPAQEESEPLLVDELLAGQEPAVDNEASRQPAVNNDASREPASRDQHEEQGSEKQQQEPEDLNDLLQVEQGQHYLQTIISHFIDYKDIIKWLIGFGSYTGVVVATVMFFSSPAPVPTTQPTMPGALCHGDNCYTEGDLKLAETLMINLVNQINVLREQIHDKQEYIEKLSKTKQNQDEKIHIIKKSIKSLEYELEKLSAGRDKLERKRDIAIDLNSELDKIKETNNELEGRLTECKTQLELEQTDNKLNTDTAAEVNAELEAQYKATLDNVQNQCQTSLDKVKGQCQHDLDTSRSQCQIDLDKVKGQCQNDLDLLKRQHQDHMDQFQEVKMAYKSCQDRSSRNQHNQERSDTETDDEDSQYNNGFTFPKHIPVNQWADKVLQMMNNTRHQIENTWAKVKNVSETLWQDHEPTISRLQQTVSEEFNVLNKFQQKIVRKLNKWLGRKQGGAAKTKRRKHAKAGKNTENEGTGLHPTVEQRIVKLSYRVDHFTAKTFRKTEKKRPDVLASIQAEFKDIDATKRIPHTREEKIKWKDYILTDDHLKWLRCHQVFWEDFMKVSDDCYAHLCCWEVKVADGNVKACKKYKRRHGLVEDRCFLELPKQNDDEDLDDVDDDINVDNDDDVLKWTSNSEQPDTPADISTDEHADNWYLEIGENRDYQRTEPDDWFFRRNNKQDLGPENAGKASTGSVFDDDLVDDDDDDVNIDDDDDGMMNFCDKYRCD